LSGKADAFEAVYEHESGIKIMPSSLSIKELTKIRTEKIKDYKEDFKKISDYIIVDSAAGLGSEALSLISMADDLIIVTNPEMPALTDALKAIKVAEQMKKSILGIIVTRVKNNDFEVQPDTVKEMLEVPILGMIPEDICILKALSLKDAVVHTHPKSNAARAYKEIAAKLLDEKYDSNKDREKLLKRILLKMKFIKN
jgi:septum site-determining protein MinD